MELLLLLVVVSTAALLPAHASEKVIVQQNCGGLPITCYLSAPQPERVLGILAASHKLGDADVEHLLTTLDIRSIEAIDLAENDLNRIPLVFSRADQPLVNLTSLNFANNLISSVSPLALSACPALAVLDLRNNGLAAASLHSFDYLTKLTSLKLSGSSLPCNIVRNLVTSSVGAAAMDLQTQQDISSACSCNSSEVRSAGSTYPLNFPFCIPLPEVEPNSLRLSTSNNPYHWSWPPVSTLILPSTTTTAYVRFAGRGFQPKVFGFPTKVVVSYYPTWASDDSVLVNSYPCKELSGEWRSNDTMIACQTQPGVGGHMFFFFNISGAIVAGNRVLLLKYPAPVVDPSSLRRVFMNGSLSAPYAVLPPAVSSGINAPLPDVVQLTGRYFLGAGVAQIHTLHVWILGASGRRFPCYVDPAYASSTSLRCTVYAGGDGSGHVVVSAAEQATVSSLVYTYPPKAIIWKVSGCSPSPANPNATFDCPPAGLHSDGTPVVLSVSGSGLVRDMVVQINGKLCSPTAGMTHSSSASEHPQSVSQYTCLLPPGTGAELDVAVSVGNLVTTSPKLLSYAAPVISRLEGCKGPDQNALALFGCATDGTSVTIFGHGFAPTADMPPRIIVGGFLVAHSVLTNTLLVDGEYTQVVFTLPRGSGAAHSIVVVQSQGLSSNSTASFSYSPCPAGTVDKDEIGISRPCVACDVGFFAIASGLDYCLGCVQGRYSNATGASWCSACQPGRHMAYFSATVCDDCPVGRATASTGASTCELCNAGLFSNTTGRTRCTACLPGFYSLAGSTVCLACQAGSAQSAPGQSSCSSCAVGTYSEQSQASRCTDCPVGKSQGQLGQAGCAPCEPGMYAPGDGMSACRRCEIGRHNPLVNMSTCENCVFGKYQDTVGQSFCQLCSPGKHTTSLSSISCNECPMGTFGNISGKPCVACPVGRSSNGSTGMTSCSECQPGFFSDAGGIGACKACPAGRFSYAKASTVCEACKRGATCVGGVIATTEGHWIDLTNSDTHFDTYSCPFGFCPGDNECAPNREPFELNPLCGHCKQGYSQWGFDCVECTQTHTGYVFLFVLLSWLIMLLLFGLSQSVSGKARIFFFFAQTSLLMFVTIRRWMPVLALLNFDLVSSTGGICITPLDPYEYLFSSVVVPLVFFGELAITYVIHYLYLAYTAGTFQLPRRFRISKDPYIRTFISLCLYSYTQITNTTFKFLQCVDVQDKEVVFTAPSISCHSERYKSTQMAVYILLLGDVVAFPLIVFVFLVYNRKAITTSGKAHVGLRRRWGIFFEPYRTDAFWWEAWAIARRTICVVVAVRIPVSNRNRFTVFALMFLVFLAIQLYWKPFKLDEKGRDVDNMLEATCLVLLLATSLFLAGTVPPFPLLSQLVITFSVDIPIFLFVVYFSIATPTKLYYKYQRWVLKQRLGDDSEYKTPGAWKKALREAQRRRHSTATNRNGKDGAGRPSASANGGVRWDRAGRIHINHKKSTTVSRPSLRDVLSPSASPNTLAAVQAGNQHERAEYDFYMMGSPRSPPMSPGTPGWNARSYMWGSATPQQTASNDRLRQQSGALEMFSRDSFAQPLLANGHSVDSGADEEALVSQYDERGATAGRSYGGRSGSVDGRCNGAAAVSYNGDHYPGNTNDPARPSVSAAGIHSTSRQNNSSLYAVEEVREAGLRQPSISSLPDLTAAPVHDPMVAGGQTPVLGDFNLDVSVLRRAESVENAQHPLDSPHSSIASEVVGSSAASTPSTASRALSDAHDEAEDIGT